MQDISSFSRKLESWNLKITEKQQEQFIKYYELLIERNKVMNLTAITEWEEVVQKHFIDSLSFVKAGVIKEQKELKLIDIGTGAGFPGIPLKILFPHWKVVLLDSLKKRVSFLNEVIQELELTNIEVIHGRAEDIARAEGYREGFDICVSRAVANLSILSEYCIPFAKVGGYFISYKSAKGEIEKKQAEHAIEILGGKVEDMVFFQLPESEIERGLIIVKKIKETNKKYPRKAGLPEKEPLK